jgi:hypothetical protein
MNLKNLTIPPALSVPKKSCRSDASLRLSTQPRPVRIKKSGRPHEQIWVRPNAAEQTARVKLRAAATLDELMCQVTHASLSPSHYSFLQRPNRFDFSRAAVRMRDIFDRFRPSLMVPMKRVATAVMTLITLVHASHHRPESFW